MKLFNFYKTSKRDYTEDMLPHNRREVFFDVLKLQWHSLLLYGFFMLLCCLPLILLSINKVYAYNELAEMIGNAAGDEQQVLIYRLSSLLDVYSVIEAASFLPIFLYMSGLVMVLRQHAWGEPVFFKTEFARGFRSNWLHMLLVWMFFGISYALSSICYHWSQLQGDLISSFAMMLPMGVFVLFILPIAAYSISVIAVYKNKFGGVMRMSVGALCSSPLKTFLALICCLAVFASFLIPSLVATMIFGALIALISPMILLGWMLFSFDRFDKYINSAQFPELVGRGTVTCDNTADNHGESDDS